MRFGTVRLPRRTVRMRLTLLYGALFILSGAGLLATTYVLMQHATAGTARSGPGAAAYSGAGESPRDADRLGDLQAQAARQRADQLRELVTQSGIALALMSVVSIGLGWLMAGRVLRPLSTITTAVRDISATNLHHRLALAGPEDELKELGDTFDELLGRLQASFRSQQRFVANASHELRTPVALQRTLVQIALSDPDATADSLRASHERVLSATYQHERLIDALLTLARGEAGLTHRQPVDLAGIAHHLLLARGVEAAERGVRVEATLDPAPTHGDAQLVERLMANLVDNALRHNLSPGRLEVSTAATADGATLSIANTGPAIPDRDLDRLFQPFQRLSADRTRHDGGLGLGLSIVTAIATAHNATIHAIARPAGGLQITVTFPAPRATSNPPPNPAPPHSGKT